MQAEGAICTNIFYTNLNSIKEVVTTTKDDKNLYNLYIIQVEIYKNRDKIYNEIIANFKKLKKVGG
ncbi:MAG TPA: hypothetical protein DC053_08810 [Lachnoclostridium sp.]|nr:hypothetical protein [Lachnoclostridium sp.]